jgi:hypothetical protein
VDLGSVGTEPSYSYQHHSQEPVAKMPAAAVKGTFIKGT